MPIDQHFTKEFLDRILGIKDTESTAGATSYYQSSGGISRWDTYISFAEGGKEAFERRERIPSKQPKKKIIFSNSLLNDSRINSLDLELIIALLRHYELYLWPGEKT